MEFFSQVARARSMPKPVPIATESGSVLLIDADEGFRHQVADCLRQAGVAVVETGEVERALDNIEAMQPDLVVCDASGRASELVLGWLGRAPKERSHPNDLASEMPIIFLASPADNRSRLRALEHGASDWLDKPIEPSELCARIFARLRDAARLRKMAALVHEDELTGLLNRRGFAGELVKVLSRVQREEVPLSVLFLDLDGFKHVNDKFGHSAGDQVLKRVASLLAGSVRTEDTVARFGGDEFVVLLPGAPRPAAEEISERLRQAIADCVFANGLQVTASIGLATRTRPGPAAEELLAEADRRMYLAKRRQKGREQIIETR